MASWHTLLVKDAASPPGPVVVLLRVSEDGPTSCSTSSFRPRVANCVLLSDKRPICGQEECQNMRTNTSHTTRLRNFSLRLPKINASEISKLNLIHISYELQAGGRSSSPELDGYRRREASSLRADLTASIG